MWSWIVPCPDPALLKQRWGGALGVALHTLGRSGLSPGISRVPCTTANVCGTRVAGVVPNGADMGGPEGPSRVVVVCGLCAPTQSLETWWGAQVAHHHRTLSASLLHL